MPTATQGAGPAPAAALTAAIQAAIQAALPPSPAPAGESVAPCQPIPAQTLFTVQGLVQVEPCITLGGIRDDLFHREKNGLEASGAVIQRGRRLLIHRELYLGWLLTRGRNAA
jgi:hypothetical protein